MKILRKLLFVVILLQSLFLFKPVPSFASEIINTWTNTTSLPYLLASQISFYNNNKLFSIGGSAVTGQSKSEVLDNIISLNGTLNTWGNSSTPTPNALIFPSYTLKDNNIYVLGGREENPGSAQNHVNKTYRGLLNSGQITQWDTLTPLPEALSIGAATTINDRIYFSGGFNNLGESSDIYMTSVNPDGTIGSWTTAGQLPEPLSGHGMVEHNGKIIIVGGQNGSGQKRSSVYTAHLNPNGTILNWETTTSLPDEVYRGGVIKTGNKLITIAGIDNNGNFSDKVYFTTINNDGSVNSWEESAHNLPVQVCCGSVTYGNGYIYFSGGYSLPLNSYLNTVYVTQLNTSQTLNVPYFNQNDSPWGPSEYDSTISLGFSNPTMDRWGCAVTSAAMIMKYHGMNEFPNGTPIDPGSLNNWLKTNKGYVTGIGSSGPYSYISWPAISKLSKVLYNANKSPVKLEHQRYYPSSNTTTQLNSDLNTESIPNILYVSNNQTTGHFVVAKGITDTSYAINDPEWNHEELIAFNNIYTQVDRYVPSQTDLSYLEIVVNPDVYLLVEDSNGNKTGSYYVNGDIATFAEIPSATYAKEGPISNPNSENIQETLGTGVNVFLLNKPTGGEYKITVSGATNKYYTLNISTYTIEGDHSIETIEGVIEPQTPNNYFVNFSQNSESEIIKTTTFDSLIKNIQILRTVQLINKGNAQALIALAQSAKNDVAKGKIKIAKIKLIAMEALLKLGGNNAIKPFAYKVINSDIQYLKSSL